MDIPKHIQPLYQQALNHDGKVDVHEFQEIKAEILKDTFVDKDERGFLTDILAKGDLETGAAKQAIELFKHPHSAPFKILLENGLKANQGKLDAETFQAFKELLFQKDQRLNDQEQQFILHTISEGAFTSEQIDEVRQMLDGAYSDVDAQRISEIEVLLDWIHSDEDAQRLSQIDALLD